MASKVIERITENAEKLSEIRQEISKKEEENKKELDVMKAERDAIQAILLQDLNKNGLSSIKTRSGDSFIRQTKDSIEITNDFKALGWAMKNMAVSVNKILVAQKLKDLKEIPDGFQIVTSEFISVRKSTKKND
jgi:hypothetical protein